MNTPATIASADTLLACALDYAARGWPVFPLHGIRAGHCTCGRAECNSPGKHPRTRQGFKDAATVAETVRQWWARWPDSNIGIATGAASGLIVLDVDPRHGGDVTLEDILAGHGPLPETVESLTGGGGRHIFFTHPGGAVKGGNGKLGPGLDVKADGGYIVAPPSLHISDRRYEWEASSDPGETPMAPCPAWLLAKLGNGKAKPAHSTAQPGHISEGARNATLTSLAGSMRRKGATEVAILAALQAENRNRCKPPLPDDEVAGIVKSIERYPAARRVSDNGDGTRAVLVRVADIQAKPLAWLWPRHVPLGKLTLLAGDPNLGKSLVTLDMAARVSRGTAWPDVPLEPGPAGNVILLSAEDDPADTIRPRLEAAGADLDRVHILQGVEYAAGGKGYFNLAADLPVLGRVLDGMADARLVIIDPISAYLGRTDSHVNAEVRSVLGPLADLAARRGVAVVVVTHLSKGMGGKALYRAIGSIAFAGAARAAWHFAADPENPQRRLMLPAKMNLAVAPTGLAYAVESVRLDGLGDVGRVAWESSPVTLTADDILATEADNGEPAGARQEAVDWLQEVLAGGPVNAVDVRKRAAADGIASRTLDRAKAPLGVKATREGFGGPWVWMLPAHSAPSPP